MRHLLLMVFNLILIGSMVVHSDAELNEDLLQHFQEVSRTESFPDTEIFLMHFDVTGDGLDEIFLCPEAILGANSLLVNFVYSPIGEGGRAYRYLGSISFSVWGFRFDKISSRMVILRSSPNEEGKYVPFVEYYSFDEMGIHRVGDTKVISNDSKGLDREYDFFESWRQTEGVLLLKAPLPEVRASILKAGGDEKVRWKDIYSKEDCDFNTMSLRYKVIAEAASK